ncbi:bifunctional tetrahydrofolate synthase/dihydrofolate synthase [Reinekea sp.]|jgi:dihydrofolate synthase/folylpolyglutamate synthase|uniref:bifunctional tetrahydrofolate synthase/dihydrofolate synthase n=1 Tax=Reinekea sp. TaxID=1970455 RepID=UPI002A7F2AF3|nr:bifunctional tetrahydrofolate synthase/dihydrofolate synthase [Reinekea sp.]
MRPSTESSLTQWLAYIEGIHAQEIELGLARLRNVAARLLHRNRPAFVFTVAGTNGKGTTTAALAALSRAAGQSVGWYSSPHLFQFNERIQIDGQPISDTQLVLALSAVEAARGEISLSYFEFTTLAAFWLFQRAQLTVWVLEVGLGGRLDAVNIIDPDIAIITNIGLDHQDFLGPDRAAIGREKAGICRAQRPVVFGSDDLPDTVHALVEQLGARPYRLGHSHRVLGKRLLWQGGELDTGPICMPRANAVTALQAFSLSPFDLTPEQAGIGLASVRLAGRMQQRIYKGRAMVLDVGHNPHAAAYIASQLGPQKYHLIIGMVQDKDVSGFCAALLEVAQSINFITLVGPRGCSAEQLAIRSGAEGSRQFGSLALALARLERDCPGEPVFIGGSFYTVSAALTLLES